ncbi:DNA repair protein RadA [Aliifodinibius sp. S!AR15-10]|uniref:DNA repair protein RadA n=1 Tax=Aliifodinibius sp. S!AR15-10 TaxID=2950437 RepID=UPI00285DBACF|nr:DNA repair protein RadA [Aliifodinibius sp. S!AR15-10]MDR8389727.1 DNA repair protein RadA [Aliifodinibius sp. S!AR15-10]
MPKNRIEYVCGECGHTSTKWLGNCPSCGKWHTFKEFTVEREKKADKSHKGKVEGLEEGGSPKSLDDITLNEEARFASNISELDRVLGGGFVPGSFVLIGGDPGIGKSTLALQIAKSNPELQILYCAGEESGGQIKQRARRLGVDSENLYIYNETDISHILKEARKMEPDLLIVDSIQTVYRTELTSMAGSIQQVKECAALFQQLAKKQEITTLLIGHVTKQGDLAGPRVLEHMVDTVLQFEGDQNYTYRLLRSLKNRFGPAQEVGVFEMNEHGLTDILNPSQLFLSDYDRNVSGNAVVCTIEGSRPLLIEVQALVTPSNYGTPQRTASGFDHRRLSLLLAVLEKRGGYQFSGQDVYLNVAGGIKLSDTAGDLGVICALVSSFLDKPISNSLVFLGEVGLGAEIRAVPKLEQRLGEIEKMGFDGAIIPKANKLKKESALSFQQVDNFNEAIKKAL